MLAYSVRIAMKSLKRSPRLTALLIGAIAIGVALSTTFAAVRHAFARDPLPDKNGTLFHVRMDGWDPMAPYPGDDPTLPPPQLTYRDTMAIMKCDIPIRQTPSVKSQLYVYPDAAIGRPFADSIRLVYSDFFAMFEAPFRYGSAWAKDADTSPEPVVVINESLNDKLFGGANSVGKTVKIHDRDFKIVGVLAHWDPGLKVYDLLQSRMDPPEDIFMPFNHLTTMKLPIFGNSDNWKPQDDPSFEGFLASEGIFLQVWAELPDKKALPAYQDYLASYVMSQKQIGRFQRPLNNRVSSITDLMADWKIVPPQADALFAVSLFFFVLCSVNLVGILLGKFLSRSSEVGVRRALGASRGDIFLQHIVECEIVGVLGGIIGIGLAMIGIAVLNNLMKTIVNRTELFKLDLPTLLFSVGLALASGLVAGVYPAWRICRIPPANHLKTT